MLVGTLLAATLAFPWPLDLRLLAVEDGRDDPAPLVEALGSSDRAVVLQAIRALGRFERPELAESLLPFLKAPEPSVRIETANALAQMKSMPELAACLEGEPDPSVRSALYEALGRLDEASERSLVRGLSEEETVRLGAMKGLERFLRSKNVTPSEATIAAIRKAARDARTAATRELALLALSRASDRDPETLRSALSDSDPGVRRLAVAGLKEWRDDPSYLVRYEALRGAGDCARADTSLSDPSEHVALLAIDLLGKGCSPAPIERILEESSGWRRPAHALVALASVAPDEARKALPRFASHPVWQARVYAARAAKVLKEDAILAHLRADESPNVVAEALVTPDDALAALASDHYGLLMAALPLLSSWDGGGRAAPALLETLARVTAQKRYTSRDPRRLLLERLSESGSAKDAERLAYLLSDYDPFIARLTADVMTAKTGTPVTPKTLRFAPDPLPLPSDEALRSLGGARALVTMKEAGAFTIELLPEAAPFTVARFVELAEKSYYDGLTFHRIVPNFVIQGGSPGANEYVGTARYLRDEVSLLSHARGTLGISTRGRDTGDGQIFVNLVDNFRLDHDYTVFARVVEGMENVDAIQEGDAIRSISILRKNAP
jgi:cyclophilin family peptidyl-prolyl cis-trans isomerase